MRFYFIFIVLCCCLQSFGQSTFYGDAPVKWESSKLPEISKSINTYTNADLIILDEKTEFYFYATNNEKIISHILLKINTETGLQKIQSFKLPQSFDIAYDANLYKQGRRSKIKTPYINEYHVNTFGARKFTNHKWTTLSFDYKFEKIRWINHIATTRLSPGEFVNDQITSFQITGLAVGDIVELQYDSDFNSNYGSNLFYFQSQWPKLKCEYSFIYKVDKRFGEYAFILPMNLKDSARSKTVAEYDNYYVFTDVLKETDLSGINYWCNTKEANELPHVFADFRFYRIATNSYPTGDIRMVDYTLFRPKNFEWVKRGDTTNNYTKVYDKQFSSVRKFVATLPPFNSDSTGVNFFKALCDTFNNFRYISSNQLFYNESALYDLYSGDHLLKRRLVEHWLWKLYSDILNDKKIFYYEANIEDRRYSEHNATYRAHYAYENRLIAIPLKKQIIYFMPRYNGIKYHLNELPFYYEGSLAALSACNFQEDIKDKESKTFKMIKTHKGTFNENTRTENGTIKISLDSLKAGVSIKESLSGQFSTILRHLYLKEYIDSTVSPLYFKKCLDKPNASAQKIKLSSNINEFPFRYTFNCSEKITLPTAKKIDLKNWFSFTLSKDLIPEIPTHDFYFDFDQSDSYNFLLDFGTPVEVTNLNDFTKKINNDYFELESEIAKNSESTYLVKAKLVVKQLSIPLEQVNLLMDLINATEELNNFSLVIAKK